MSLLRDIQADVTNPSADIATILRKCKILAHRLKSAELASWIDLELNGYASGDDVPPYRHVHPHYFARFMSVRWRADRVPIPLEIFPDSIAERLRTFGFPDGIASVTTFAEKDLGGMIDQTRMIPLLQGKLYPEMNCNGAWCEIPSAEFRQILSAVRNRVLDFVLAIEAENPDAGEAVGNTQPVPREKVATLVNNYFHGSVGNFAQNSSQVDQSATLNVGDVAEAVAALREHLHELALSEGSVASAQAQIATIEAQLRTEPNPAIVREAGRTLRNLVEGAIAGMLTNAAQPAVIHWWHQVLNKLG